ncbi:ROK family transcriptional regulator [Amycolatopsis jiangsuensis]|uniref:Putative NBD/HSP70 family sugar kinase n=1 Tax=Amycolatopsis jiangsuensis TaxID=1181879 RepID=A0A840J6B5_9PSEU|nr:ROK family transcriptional regulator [Amycolatopsis jiangsuensis]MBB4688947.1 putative NBD/HSP70 family sugar kinase [Amycolatopsis jiangsuensis]
MAQDSAGPLRLLWLIAHGQAASRMELARALGLPQSTVSVRTQALIAAGVLAESGEGRSAGGRRPKLLSVNAGFGHVWAADVGSRHVRIGALDMAGDVLCVRERPLDIDRDPADVVAAFVEAVEAVIAESDCPGRTLGLGVAFPGPVDVDAGTITLPSRMPGWRGFAVRETLCEYFDLPVVVDNDANLQALGESVTGPPGRTLLAVKAGTGIGSGLVVGGELYRGRAGVAGDISHVRVPAAGDRPCACGNRGCLETVASGAALVAQLREQGIAVESTAEVMATAEDGHPVATTAVRRAGLQLGEVLATVVNFSNPDEVLLGGALSGSEAFVAAVRGALYERCLPLATRELRIDRVRFGADAGLYGAGALALDEVFDRAIRSGR